MDQNSSNRLINKRLKAGDVAFFEHLYEEYFCKAVYYARQYLKSEEMARDVAQDSFFTLWEKRHEINEQLSVQALILTIVKNKCLNILRKRVNEQKYSSNLLKRDEMASYMALCDSTSDSYLLVEMADLMEEALAEMPEKMSVVFRLNREEELTYDEIAKQLDISVKTVEYRMSKALFFFRLKFKDYLPLFLFSLLKNLFRF